MPANVSETQLEAAFTKFGAVADLSIKRESKCAFVTMRELQAAVAASQGLHGGEMGLKVEFIETGDKATREKANERPVVIKKTVVSPAPAEKPAAAATATATGSPVGDAAPSIPLPKPKGAGETSLRSKEAAGDQPVLAIPKPKPPSAKSDKSE